MWKQANELVKIFTPPGNKNLPNKNFENEKASLLTAIQITQNDCNQCSRKVNTTEKSWNVVTNNGRNQTQPKSLQNSTRNEMPVGKPPINYSVFAQNQLNVNQADQINSEYLSIQQHDPTCEQLHSNLPITNHFAGLDVEELVKEIGFDFAASNETQMPAKSRQKNKHKESTNSLRVEQKGSNQVNNKDDQNQKPHTTVLIRVP